jgi:hypothetical protein
MNYKIYWILFATYFLSVSVEDGITTPLVLFEFYSIIISILFGGHDGIILSAEIAGWLIFIGQSIYILSLVIKSNKLKTLLIASLMQIVGAIIFQWDLTKQMNELLLSYSSLLPYIVMTIIFYYDFFKQNKLAKN